MNRAAFALALAVAASHTACERQDAAPRTETAAASAPASAVVTAEKGPVRVTLALSPGAPALSDEPTLTLTVVTGAHAAATLPPFSTDPSNAGAFRVLDLRDPPARVDTVTGEKTQERICRLEPLESGEQVIAPIKVAFTTDGDAEPHEITTDPLRVTVGVPHDGEAASLDRLRPPIEPRRIEVPHPVRWGLVIASAAGFVVLLAAFVLLFARRRRRPVVPPTAEELARSELERLLADDPVARGELATFYVELTAIVRRYVERTTGIRAPEQTTEEFLRACQARGVFDRETRERLGAFLEAADLVKFAAGRPSRDDIADSLARARRFCGLEARDAALSAAAR